MKFGKSLSNQIEETLPEWRDKFLSYKDLKKRLKLIDPPPSSSSSSSSTTNAAAAAAPPDGPPPAKRPRLPHSTPDEADTAAKAAPYGAAKMTAEEEGFMTLLEAELDKFNTFFVEKEEEYIIRQKELQDRLRTAKDSKEEMMKVRKEIVDFHGEMVLLENYSALNYTGLVKILKKYDKRTGALIRLPFIQKVLQQPFFTTDLLDKLIKQCERMLDGLLLPSSLSAADDDPPSSAVGEEEDEEEEEAAEVAASSSGDAATEQQQQPQPREKKKKKTTTGSTAPACRGRRIPELEEIEYMESLYMKSTLAALRVLREIRSRSSTVSVFSLPPLQTSGAVENRWPNVPVLEQTAK